MSTLVKRLVLALRVLRRSPVFTITAMLTLALGIGATTAIFSVANTVLLRTLPYPHADRLVLVWSEMRARGVRDFPIAPGDFPDLREQATHFEELAAVIPGRQALRSEGLEPEQIRTAAVTPNLLPLLGARIAVGRGFVADDARPQPAPPEGAGAPGGAAPGGAAGPPPTPLPQMVVLSHGLWERRFGGEPGIVGRRIDLGFGGAEVVGVPVALASEQLERIAAGFRELVPIKKTADVHMYAESMHGDLVADVRPAIVTLLGAVGFVLLIACANVANLLLVRAAARERELAVRAALGGTPGRLMVPLLAEVGLIAAGGALLGLLLAFGGIRLLAAVAPPDLPRVDEIGLDPMVLGFTMLVTMVAALVFGLVPSLRASRPDLAEVLRAGRTSGLITGRLLRQGVVVAEVALAFVLLAAGGLMVRSFVALQNSPPGFDATNMLTFQAGLQSPDDDARAAFQRQLAERLRALPEVRSVTAASPLPLSGETMNARWGTPEAASDPAKFQQADVRAVLPGYFQAMGTRLLAGRAFTEADNTEDATGILVDRVLAEKAFPGRSAVGQRLLVRLRGNEPEPLEIIGVVDHQRHETLVADGREAIYVTDGFVGTGVASRWAVRTVGDPADLAPTVRRIVAELDVRTPIAEMQSMQVLVSRAMAHTRFALVLIGVFAAVAALLACVGLYGVLATAVRQRTTELGVRLALGAPAGSIFRLVVREGLTLSATGIVVGGLAALPLTGVMRSLLVGVGATDPTTFASVALLFLGVAALASWAPGRRAARLDPTHALRGD